MEYTPEQVNALTAKIRPDGSVDDPSVLSVEDAMRLSGQTPPETGATEPPEEKPPEGSTEEKPPEGETKPGEKPGIELDTKEDPPITVGGITKPTSTWVDEMEKEYNVDTAGLPAEARQKMVEGYINTKHRTEWQKQNTQKAQETGEQRRIAEHMKAEAEFKLRQAEAAKMATQQIQQRLAKEKAQLSKIAQVQIDPASLRGENGEVDPAKQYEFNKVLMARDRLRDIDTELTDLEQQVAKAEVDRTVVEIESFQADHPEYITGEPLLAVIQKVEGQGMKNHPDVDKVLDIYDILDYARSRGVPLSMAYDRLASQGKLTVKRATTLPEGSTGAPPLPETKSQAQQKVVAAIKGKQTAANPTLDGAGSIPGRTAVQTKQTVGDKIREASMRVTGGTGNEALEKLGY